MEHPVRANSCEREEIACSRRSDSGARAKNKAGERAGKNEGRLGERTSPLPQSPLVFFPALSLALFFARAPLSERLEQAREENAWVPGCLLLTVFSF